MFTLNECRKKNTILYSNSKSKFQQVCVCVYQYMCMYTSINYTHQLSDDTKVYTRPTISTSSSKIYLPNTKSTKLHRPLCIYKTPNLRNPSDPIYISSWRTQRGNPKPPTTCIYTNHMQVD